MEYIIGVRFRDAGRVYYFSPGGHSLQKGDHVVVETAKGMELGEVMMGNTPMNEGELQQPLKVILRVATPADLERCETRPQREAEAYKICVQKIKEHELAMQLVRAEYAFEGNKILFSFTAEHRVDFRALVRDLAHTLHARIELRQIGQRDIAKQIGGLGICGRPFCCQTFLKKFQTINLQLARDQNLGLNPSKVSGACGRLMCCLQFEHANYIETRKTMPAEDSVIETPAGAARVLELNCVNRTVRVQPLEAERGAQPLAFYVEEDGKIVKREAPVREPAQTDHYLLESTVGLGNVPLSDSPPESPEPPEEQKYPRPRQTSRRQVPYKRRPEGSKPKRASAPEASPAPPKDSSAPVPTAEEPVATPQRAAKQDPATRGQRGGKPRQRSHARATDSAMQSPDANAAPPTPRTPNAPAPRRNGSPGSSGAQFRRPERPK